MEKCPRKDSEDYDTQKQYDRFSTANKRLRPFWGLLRLGHGQLIEERIEICKVEVFTAYQQLLSVLTLLTQKRQICLDGCSGMEVSIAITPEPAALRGWRG